MHVIKYTLFVIILLFLIGCTKDKQVLVPDNTAPDYSGIPTIKIQNYINRTFIDLIGREPSYTELDEGVSILRAGTLSKEVRIAYIKKLQESTDFVEGDGSYLAAYHLNIYGLAKARCLEGASDAEMESGRAPILHGIEIDSLNGDLEGVEKGKQELKRIDDVLTSKDEMQQGKIFFNDMLARMANCPTYDKINMNTFNFINATFDNFFWRYPTSFEFEQGYNMVEHNIPSVLFGQSGQTKADYLNILKNNGEIYEGAIIWCYRLLVARAPSTQETYALLPDFVNHKRIQIIQQQIMSTDEYANF